MLCKGPHTLPLHTHTYLKKWLNIHDNIGGMATVHAQLYYPLILGGYAHLKQPPTNNIVHFMLVLHISHITRREDGVLNSSS